MTPGPLREQELNDPAQLLRWLNSLRDAVRDLERRPRAALWNAGPIDGSGGGNIGSIYLDTPPWTVGAVVLSSVARLDGSLSLGGGPYATFRKLTDGRIKITYVLPGVTTGKYLLTFMLVEAANG